MTTIPIQDSNSTSTIQTNENNIHMRNLEMLSNQEKRKKQIIDEKKKRRYSDVSNLQDPKKKIVKIAAMSQRPGKERYLHDKIGKLQHSYIDPKKRTRADTSNLTENKPPITKMMATNFNTKQKWLDEKKFKKQQSYNKGRNMDDLLHEINEISKSKLSN